MAAIEAAGDHMNAPGQAQPDKILIRNCDQFEEFEACVEIQKKVWGYAEADLIPARVLLVAHKIGGQVIGAFDGDEMVAFAFSFPGNRNGNSYLHSHMLAVRPEYRNAGLGRRVKLFQREEGLSRGFELMEWTFDPLEIKNAHLNIERLGAIARRYTINQYGNSSSPLHGGLPTDRLTAEWWLKSKRVEKLLGTGKKPAFETAETIDVTGEIYRWKAEPETRPKAAEVQLRNREKFLKAFSDGLCVLGYERDVDGNGRYLLGKWDESWSYAKS